jgi:hypothetical protein
MSMLKRSLFVIVAGWFLLAGGSLSARSIPEPPPVLTERNRLI